MSFLECLKISLYNLRQRRMRAILNMIGVGIGVAAITFIVSLGEGSQIRIRQEIEKLGSDLIWIYPRFEIDTSTKTGNPNEIKWGRQYVGEEDTALIKRLCPAVAEVARTISSGSTVKFQNNYNDCQITGTVPEYQSVYKLRMQKGRFLSGVDLDSLVKVCVFEDSQPLRELFASQDPVGKTVLLNDQEFTVIGVVKQKASEVGQQAGLKVYLPLTTLATMVGRNQDQANMAYIRVRDSAAVKETATKIEKILAQRHMGRVTFRAGTAQDVMETAKQTTDVLTLAFSGVAAIALLVGGIGIMNTMLVSVVERTREIGIVKAEGARSRDILMQFLIEAVLLTSIGGLAGVVLGIGIDLAVAPMVGLPIVISLVAIIAGLVFSMGTGIVAGAFPAHKASKLDPIIALRYQ